VRIRAEAIALFFYREGMRSLIFITRSLAAPKNYLDTFSKPQSRSSFSGKTFVPILVHMFGELRVKNKKAVDKF
jgi:hypothetical protein